jgi:hypothetical protein
MGRSAGSNLDADLYRAAKVEAARSDRNVRDIVAAALEAWRAADGDAEDAEDVLAG